LPVIVATGIRPQEQAATHGRTFSALSIRSRYLTARSSRRSGSP